MMKYWREFMIQSVNLTNDFFWLGILDPHLDVFDIIMET